ncbi:hypothetical protein ABFG93_13270 [Pseudalkalibacillus hwajinpoensis]|uniref:hypothetical protein n=1 Tax=Guptibacillus hwajinpoensis TaxID=208199 RepID=UPI00325BD89F
MNREDQQNSMWLELQEFVKQVESENKQSGAAKPYIDQIRKILSKNTQSHGSLKTE